MSAPESRDPLVVRTFDGVTWVRAAVTQSGRGLYVLEGTISCPEFVMATLAELAELGVTVAPVTGLAEAVALMGALPMPVGSVPVAPVVLTEQQVEALVDAGNGALGSYYHERACACSEYPAGCATDPLYAGAAGYWDTDAFAIGLPAVIALWESMRTPAPGALAEQRHLMDPLDNTLTHLADQTPATSACNTCGDTPEMWCPSCAACRKGCDSGLIDNPCTHPNAPWQVTS